MKSLTEINLNYAKAIKQAEQLDAIAKELSNLAEDSFKGSLDTISANWKGINAQAFVQKGTKLESDISTSAKNLKSTAATIRKIAKNIKEADIRARNIALSSGGGGGFR